jgi:hypothetical protein
VGTLSSGAANEAFAVDFGGGGTQPLTCNCGKGTTHCYYYQWCAVNVQAVVSISHLHDIVYVNTSKETILVNEMLLS